MTVKVCWIVTAACCVMLAVLKCTSDDKRDTPGLMVSYARLHGAPDVTLNAVDRVVSDLARGGKVKLKPARNKMDSDERWIAV